MFSKQIRFLLIALALVAVVWFLKQKNYVLVAFSGMLILYMIWSYFRHGTVALAAKSFRNKDFLKTKALLSQIQNPDRLLVKRRGYYEFMLANIALQEQDYELAMQHFQIASSFPLHSENDKAYVLLHLANLNLRKKEYERAQVYLSKAKQFKVSAKVNELIQKIEREINN